MFWLTSHDSGNEQLEVQPDQLRAGPTFQGMTWLRESGTSLDVFWMNMTKLWWSSDEGWERKQCSAATEHLSSPHMRRFGFIDNLNLFWNLSTAQKDFIPICLVVVAFYQLTLNILFNVLKRTDCQLPKLLQKPELRSHQISVPP